MDENKLTTRPYKGVRDFYPEDYAVQKYIFDTMRSSAERFGYQEYDASVLEPAELYVAKSGEEIINEQTYTFMDRGGREVTLRPEMTPTVARMVAGRRRELPYPLRWYSIPNLFRYERPQRGRLREHWQLNVDIFGVTSLRAEVELISVAYTIMKDFGLDDEQFVIRINNRALVQKTLAEAGLNTEQSYAMQKLLDRKEKMPVDEFAAAARDITGDDFDYAPEINETLTELLTLLARAGVTNVEFVPTLMRGFDYYTGVVFEVFDTGTENNRSLFGGGRYDDLLDVFGSEKVPTVGFGMGDVAIRDVLETYDLLPSYCSTSDICVCYADADRIDEVDMLVQAMRADGVNVVTAHPDKKVGDQIKYADKLGVRFVVCIGSHELDTKECTIKELSTGKEMPMRIDVIDEFIFANRN